MALHQKVIFDFENCTARLDSAINWDVSRAPIEDAIVPQAKVKPDNG